MNPTQPGLIYPVGSEKILYLVMQIHISDPEGVEESL